MPAVFDFLLIRRLDRKARPWARLRLPPPIDLDPYQCAKQKRESIPLSLSLTFALA